MEIRFVSKNSLKIQEVQEILRPKGIRVIPISLDIPEIQTRRIDDLVKDKVLKAFKSVGRPLLVEHTALYIDYLNGFPGGLTQIFWDSVGPERCAALFGENDRRVRAETVIGYTDAKRIELFRGELYGTVAPKPSDLVNPHSWDCVFIPDGESDTFAQMKGRKNQISMRKLALDHFAAHVTRG